MDGADIDVAVVCSVATSTHQFEPILKWSRSVAGPRLLPFPSLLPLGENALRNLSRIAAEGFRGIKLHPEYQDFYIDDSSLSGFYERAAERDLVILFHAGYDIGFPDSDRSAPARIAQVHRSFPRLRIIASHLGGFRQWDEVLRDLAGSDVYLDTSYIFRHIPDGTLREILDAHRPDRILFGSDSPWADQRESVHRLQQLELDPVREEQILSRNAKELLGIGP
jgi:predicted TIM-barrel fold metal-dependent hydrolase